jgi:hypothetical protein
MEPKFFKSLANRGTENTGLALLLQDPRFQLVDLKTKRSILELVGSSEAFGHQTFDLVMTTEPSEQVTAQNVGDLFPGIRLVEMKTTKKPIRSSALNGFFFGATEREYAMATALGDQYVFAFVVLSPENEYGRPFAVLLTLAEVEARTRSRRVQYQVNFRSDIEPDAQNVVLLLSDHPLSP